MNILVHFSFITYFPLSIMKTRNTSYTINYQLGDYEVAWVDAEVGKTDDDTLSLLPPSKPAAPHKSVFLGDLKLSDFKQFLASKGVPVSFRVKIMHAFLVIFFAFFVHIAVANYS